MICPKCKEEGKKSKVYIGYSTTTCMYFAPYYDEDGRHHHHDGNTTTTRYSCSNGHEFSEQRTGTCWCGWGTE